MERIKAFTRRHPRIHGIAMTLNERQLRVRRHRDRRSARSILGTGEPVRFAVIQEAGLGGLLLQVASALQLADERSLVPHVELRSSNYASSREGAAADWLPRYFDRKIGPLPDSTPLLPITDLIHPHAPHLPMGAAASHVWGYMEIASAIRDEAARYLPTTPFAAVHFRGSDKMYEARRADPASVLDRVEAEMAARGLERVLVASDEAAFLSLARDQFGSAALTLPQQALANGNVPPHLTSAPGDVKAKEAVLTMAALGEAEVLVRTESYLSAWASTLNPSQTEIVIRPSRTSP